MIRVTGKTYEAKDKLSKCGLKWDGSAWAGTEETLTSYGRSKLSGICSAYNLDLNRSASAPVAPAVYSDAWVKEYERADSSL